MTYATAKAAVEVFPAHAGMNRRPRIPRVGRPGVPRTRGDEPIWSVCAVATMRMDASMCYGLRMIGFVLLAAAILGIGGSLLFLALAAKSWLERDYDD